MSRLDTQRDAVRDAVNALGVMTGRSLTAVSTWIPADVNREDVADGGEVWIAPGGDPIRQTNVNGRGNTDETMTFQVAIMQPLGDDPDATAAANNTLAEGIIDGLLLQKAGSRTCIEGRQLQPADVNHWRTNRLFISIIELRYR